MGSKNYSNSFIPLALGKHLFGIDPFFQKNGSSKTNSKAKIQYLFNSKLVNSKYFHQFLIKSNENLFYSFQSFLQKQIPSDKKRLLERCCQFDYADGVIERVQFDQEDEAWSKNMKRGVLQMIQLNLKRNNAQGLRNEMNDDQQGQQWDQEEDNEQQNGQQQDKDTLAMSFTIPEVRAAAFMKGGFRFDGRRIRALLKGISLQEQKYNR